MNKSLKPLKLTFAISLLSLGFTPIHLQPIESRTLMQRTGLKRSEELRLVQSSSPSPAQGAPEPPRTPPGGDRNPCPGIPKSLTALVPVTKKNDGSELRLGKTIQAHPTFWFYVPYESKSIKSAKFSLRDREGVTLYETPLNMTGIPGIISASLPSTEPSLEIGKYYQYYLFIYVDCTPNSGLEPENVQGWVRREKLSTTLESQLAGATPQQQAELYAKNKFWYDALRVLAELKNTNQMNDDWAKLLRSNTLEAIATEPLVKCCTP